MEEVCLYVNGLRARSQLKSKDALSMQIIKFKSIK
jgi:hypothetical protein